MLTDSLTHLVLSSTRNITRFALVESFETTWCLKTLYRMSSPKEKLKTQPTIITVRNNPLLVFPLPWFFVSSSWFFGFGILDFVSMSEEDIECNSIVALAVCWLDKFFVMVKRLYWCSAKSFSVTKINISSTPAPCS